MPRLSIHGVEKTDETGRLCRLNLAVHGLEGEIKHGGNINSYYDDPHDATGRFDFVLANPPFNVNAVDTAMRVSARRHSEGTPQDLPERQDHERLKDMVGPGRRFPFGLPRTDNANHLWIQLSYSARPVGIHHGQISQEWASWRDENHRNRPQVPRPSMAPARKMH